MHTVHSDYAETAYSYHGVKVVAVVTSYSTKITVS